MWHSGLRIGIVTAVAWVAAVGFGLIPGPGPSACIGQKEEEKKKKKKGKQSYFTSLLKILLIAFEELGDWLSGQNSNF